MSGSINLTLLEQRLSPERLGPYRRACGGDLSAAVDLYAWNARVDTRRWIELTSPLPQVLSVRPGC